MSSVEAHGPHPTATTTQRKMRARLAAFDNRRKDLLAILERACKRKPKTTFDKMKAWRDIRFMAIRYLEEEADIEERRMLAPAADRAKLMKRLGTALCDGRCRLNEMMHDDLRGRLFLEWCEAHGDPDLSDPVMDQFDAEFEQVVTAVVVGLADLEAAAFRAAEQLRHRRGRPDGMGLLQHDFIIALESTYRGITGKPGGAGPGPFTEFVKELLAALGRECVEQTVIDAIKDAKRREVKSPSNNRWGRSLFAD